MVGMCVALVKDLRRDPLMLRAELGTQLMEQAVIAGVAEHGHEDFAIVLEPTEDSDPGSVRAAVVTRGAADAAHGASDGDADGDAGGVTVGAAGSPRG